MAGAFALLVGATVHPAQAATVAREVQIDADPAAVWDAVRDVGAVERRLAPGFVVSDHLEGGLRTVTFSDGVVVHEIIVSIDDASRRVAYASVGGATTHHNASMQVFASGRGARLVWITDLLPDTLTAPIAARVEKGLAVMKVTLERKP